MFSDPFHLLEMHWTNFDRPFCSQAVEKDGNKSYICWAWFYKKASKIWAVHSSYRIAVHESTCYSSRTKMYLQSRDNWSEEKSKWSYVHLSWCHDEGNYHWGNIFGLPGGFFPLCKEGNPYVTKLPHCFPALPFLFDDLLLLVVTKKVVLISLITLNFRWMSVNLVWSHLLGKLYGVRLFVLYPCHVMNNW